MLSPSDFNNAVPQFTNGTYASNPVNPQYIAEPNSTDYNRGTEPLQTLPAQWWNWFINKFTGRFNKVNIYVKNLFNELAQLLSVVDMSPDGTEGTPTVGQLKCMFQCEYPTYLKGTTAMSSTYVPQTTKVNGHALCGNVTITCVACAGANGSGTAFGTASTVNTGTAVGCIPTVGTALGTTDGQFLATDASGNLKPSGYSASCFRAKTWTPSLVACACCGKNGSSYSAFGSNAFNSTAFTTCTGTVTQVKVGTTAYNPSSGVISLPAYPTCVACAGANGSGTAFGTAAVKTAGSAAGNVPLVGTALGTTNGQLVATDASGKLKPSGYTASCFLGATSKACEACKADLLFKTVNSTKYYAFIDDVYENDVIMKAATENQTYYLRVDCAKNAGVLAKSATYCACTLNTHYCGLYLCKTATCPICVCSSNIESYIVAGWYCCGNNKCSFNTFVSAYQGWTCIPNSNNWHCCSSNECRSLYVYRLY